MYKLTTYTELEVGHRLLTSYAMKCQHLHGHRYEVEITVSAEYLNADNMIVDFKKLKEVVKKVLDDKWDHGFALCKNDPLVESIKNDIHTERLHIVDENPTLEWMVKYWYFELQKAFDEEHLDIRMYSLKASETAKNTCEYSDREEI